MAVTTREVQITWSASNSGTCSAGSSLTSDAASLNADAVCRTIQFKVDNNGTPASGDTATCYILGTNGDPDGTGSDEFGTVGAARWIATLDTNGDADPAISTPVEIPVAMKDLKAHVINNQGTRDYTVSATIYETYIS